jgi:hypothetical protein
VLPLFHIFGLTFIMLLAIANGEHEDRTEVGVSQHRPFGLAGSASSVLENCDLILKVAARVALKPAVIVDKRGKFNLTTGTSDAICRWSKRRARQAMAKSPRCYTTISVSNLAVPLSAAICG